MSDPSGGEWQEDCYLVYARAPEGMHPDEANLRFNEYLGDDRRGIIVNHDHFEYPHGAIGIFYVREPSELEALHDLGPLTGWDVNVHKLVFGVTAVGWVKQGDFTIQRFRNQSVEDIEAAEGENPRYWWREGGMADWVANATRADEGLTERFGAWDDER